MAKQTLTTEEIQLPFESDLFKTAWDEWLEFRKQRKIPKYVPIGLKRTFTHLLKISENNEVTAIAIINQSIEQSYQGLFPLKNNSQYVRPYQQPITENRFTGGAAKLLAKGKDLYAATRRQ